MTRPRLAAALTLIVLAVTATPAIPTATASAGGTITATVRISPLTIDLDLPQRPVAAGQQVLARATIRNLGDTPIEDLAATIHLTETSITTDGTTRQLGTLDGGRRTQAAWQLCSDQPGSYLILARAEGTLNGTPLVAYSPARHLTITPPPGRRAATCR